MYINILNHCVKHQTHDDRLDALSIAVNYWVEQMAADADKKIVERKNENLDLELEKFMAHVIGKERFQSVENTWM